ncbi:MAG TPA: thiamine pyrophosphate-dependent enzyme, partial [Terriglobia bacterium]|nr:thiamine pyrophosphate-dependent enzyme [Terriglobia bacterium]
YARGGHGPSLIECKTFRMTGHSAHDDAGYVPQELFDYWETRDPIRRLERTLIQQNALTDAGIAEMQKGIHQEIDEAIAIAEKDPYPDPEDCLRDVYFEE